MKTNTVEITHEELVLSFQYLDELRESGRTNMFGARPWLADEFGYDKKKSQEIMGMWMASFDPSKTMEQRIKDVLK